MKNSISRKSRAGQAPSTRRRARTAAALIAACGLGLTSLTFASSAQAASSYNLMLTKVLAGVGSIYIYKDEPSNHPLGCFQVQSDRDKNTGVKVNSGDDLRAYSYGDSTCGSGGRGTARATVGDNLGTTNFWFQIN